MIFRIIISGLFAVCSALIYAQEAIIFGVVPQQTASKLAAHWIPITAYLSEEVGVPIRFATKPSISLFEQELADQTYDIAYMNPYHYTVFSDQSGYVAIAKAKDKVIKGIIVVPKESDMMSLRELAGRDMAFPSPGAFAASILSRGFLQQQEIPINPVYVKSHDSVYLNVQRGVFPAGGGVRRTFNAVDPKVRDGLKVLWESDGFTPHAIAVKGDVSTDMRQRLQQAFVKMSIESPELLEPLKIKGFVAANDSDWDDVRALNIKLDLGVE